VSLDPGADLGHYALPVLGVYPGPGQAQAPRHLRVPVLGGYTQDAKHFRWCYNYGACTLIKNKLKFSSYVRKFKEIVCKVIYD
jgi:hypothetical protein